MNDDPGTSAALGASDRERGREPQSDGYWYRIGYHAIEWGEADRG